ncbi:glycosyltransferase [Timonella sp. A28]|uniref:glycosyltransferase n=1 Tax=Timonella sp. A28 TaxID=3442640 RepID=UPI003EBAEE59
MPLFSVLLPFYAGDHADFVVRAIESVTTDQTLAPHELVVVQDGPVSAELEDAVKQSLAAVSIPHKLVVIAENGGLSNALNVGLRECTHDVVARSDADDISVPKRFEIQIPVIAQGIDLVGAALAEFEDDETATSTVRAQPTNHADIVTYAKFHDPFNHPTVVYRKSAVESVGGYEHLDLMEDYLLFAKMLHAGVRSANIPDVLLKYRVGAGAYGRRGGTRLLRSEWALQRKLRAMGFTSRTQFVRNVVIRCGYRLVPEPVRRFGYRQIVLRTGKRGIPAQP